MVGKQTVIDYVLIIIFLSFQPALNSFFIFGNSNEDDFFPNTENSLNKYSESGFEKISFRERVAKTTEERTVFGLRSDFADSGIRRRLLPRAFLFANASLTGCTRVAMATAATSLSVPCSCSCWRGKGTYSALDVPRACSSGLCGEVERVTSSSQWVELADDATTKINH